MDATVDLGTGLCAPLGLGEALATRAGALLAEARALHEAVVGGLTAGDELAGRRRVTSRVGGGTRA